MVTERNNNQSLLRATEVVKEFSGVRVLNRINFDLAPGEVLGIIGENGAGKSTLIKIISGIYQLTSGALHLNGRAVEIKSPLAAKRLGISTVPQEFNLIGQMTVFENIFLGSELRSGPFLDKSSMRRRTAELLNELNSDISPEDRVETLSVAQKQMVEIAKALVHDSKILILDEPTTVLTKQEVALLFSRVRDLAAKGVAVVFISHKLHEISEICDRVLILRDGEQISLTPAGELDEQEMALRMVGRELTQLFPEKAKPREEVALAVEDLTVPGFVEKASFELHRGEVLGLAGLLGSGQTEMAEAVMGFRRISAGRIAVKGRTLERMNPRNSIDAGIAYLSEDRQGKGLVLNFDIPANITLSTLKKYGRMLINKKAEREKSDGYVKRFNIRAVSLLSELQYLSGGNQQKVYLAKAMDIEPEILILNEPTRGIDVNAKSEIYHFVNALAADGIACLIISSEMEEIIGVCSRVLVMRDGRITGQLNGRSINEEDIMLYAAGLKSDPIFQETPEA